MAHPTKQVLIEVRAELHYLTKTRRPRLVRLLMSIPLLDDAMYSIRAEQVLVDKEIARLVAIIRKASIIYSVDIEDCPSVAETSDDT